MEATLVDRERDTALRTRSKTVHDLHTSRSSPERDNRQRQSLRKGWRAGLVAATCVTTGIFIVNLIVTICASAYFDLEEGIGDIYIGSCDVVDRWSLGLHLLVNGLGTAIFSASNYTMQCLVAPTRKECDIAHAHGDWLDIGVPSVRNMLRNRIHWKRRTAWALLALSSIPIHFLYNSAVFKELSNNADSLRKVAVSPQFLETEYIDFSIFAKYNITALYDGHAFASELHAIYWSSPSSFDELGPEKCSNSYGRKIISSHSHLLIVLNATIDFGSITVTDANGNKPWPNWTDIGLSEADAAVLPPYW